MRRGAGRSALSDVKDHQRAAALGEPQTVARASVGRDEFGMPAFVGMTYCSIRSPPAWKRRRRLKCLGGRPDDRVDRRREPTSRTLDRAVRGAAVRPRRAEPLPPRLRRCAERRAGRSTRSQQTRRRRSSANTIEALERSGAAWVAGVSSISRGGDRRRIAGDRAEFAPIPRAVATTLI